MELKPAKQDRDIIIVGAGVFGLTTALELRNRGYRNVTILDRFLPPVPDGSSVDISRVIRPDYADAFYAKLGLEAMEGWNTEFAPYFHRSGLLCVSQTKDHPYLVGSRQNLTKMGLSVEQRDGNSIQQMCQAFRGNTRIAGMEGYFNNACGWADARGSIECLARRCTEAGICFISGARGTVTSLITVNKEVIGVRTKCATSVFADTVIIATGAWTPYLVDMSQTSVSTGQPVGFIQLSSEEADRMRSCPVTIDLSTGWFCFPPTPNTNIFKVVRHGYGYETRHAGEGSVEASAPSIQQNNAVSGYIPDDAERALRDGLKLFFPQLQNRPFVHRRLCWYTDTATGDFVVDYHPEYSNLFMACGGSGHAFKFLPVLGRYIVDSFEQQASKIQQTKWAWRVNSTPVSKGDGSRGGPPRRVLSRDEQARL